MTGAQLISIAITVLAIFGGVLINNARLGDVKDALRAEAKADNGEIVNMIAELRRIIEGICGHAISRLGEGFYPFYTALRTRGCRKCLDQQVRDALEKPTP